MDPKPAHLKSHVHAWIIILVALVIILFIAAAMLIARPGDPELAKSINSKSSTTQSSQPAIQSDQTVQWSFDGNKWNSNTTAPACADPLVIPSPVNINLATNILYPGQVRGGDFKPHGGFIFQGKKNSDITVTAPLDATVFRGSRYIEQGEVQYLFDFINPCGIYYRFDHLQILSPQFANLAEQLPTPAENSSATNNITGNNQVKAGDVIATSVGFTKNNNVSVDFGVYDLRYLNVISQDSTWASQHASKKETAFYAICWLDKLPAAEKVIARALPGSGTEGKVSDYCK